jgi:hypothetical protein
VRHVNSFVVDYLIRMRVTNNSELFLPLSTPRPPPDRKGRGIPADCGAGGAADLHDAGVRRSGEGDLRRAGDGKSVGATDPAERAKLRAELDALVAHLYGLTEEEFAYILTTFPLVPDAAKIAAHNAFRNVERGLVK